MMELRSQTEETQPNEQKAVPFAVRKGWVGVPNAIFTVYTKHPDMNSTASLVYGYLLHRHNDKYGYAYPTQETIAIDLGVSPGTVKASVAKLLKVGLIEVNGKSRFNNNQYTFPTICETLDELLQKFPEIDEHLKKLEASAEKYRKEAQDDKGRLATAFRGEKT